jgi:hypothetical protein
MRRSAVHTCVALAVLGSLPAGAEAQRRKPAGAVGSSAEQTSLAIEAQVGDKRFQASGKGECKYAPEASINGLAASLWMVRYGGQSGSIRRLSLTLWRPKDGAEDQLSFELETKAGMHRISRGEAGENTGEGSVTILPSGPGGRLEITGKDTEGKALQIAVDCSAFGGVEAEGG